MFGTVVVFVVVSANSLCFLFLCCFISLPSASVWSSCLLACIQFDRCVVSGPVLGLVLLLVVSVCMPKLCVKLHFHKA